MVQEISAGIIVFRKDHDIKYLLLHYRGDYWGLAKGLIEKGEKEKDAAIREVKEETGIEELEFIEGFREVEKYFYRNKDKELVNKQVIYFLAKTEGDEVKLSFEHKGYEWLSLDEALKRLKYKNHRDLLKKADEFIKKGSIQKKLL